MCGEMVATSLRTWLVVVFVGAINALPGAEGRSEAISWLCRSAEILSAPGSGLEKVRDLNQLLGSGKGVAFVADLVRKSIADYRSSSLPFPVKVALPVTLMALPLLGGQGLGMAALGGALGGPALLLVFLGTAGISSILESVAATCGPVGYSRAVDELVSRDPVLSGTSAPLREAMRAEPRRAVRYDLPRDEDQLRRALQGMDPFDFECHVMSFFEGSGMEAWVTRKSNDMGVDGFACHPKGLIVVQCKRNAAGNMVGRPVVQQMKGVVVEHNALCGYLVTTSRFSDKARYSAEMSSHLVLVDMPELVRWHEEPPRFCA